MSATFPQHATLPQGLFDDKKINAMTLLGVLTLHVAIGFGLVTMPMLKLTPPKITPPIEITFVAPTPPPPEAIKPEIQPEPKIQPPIQPKAEPVRKEVIKPLEKPEDKTPEQRTLEQKTSEVKTAIKPMKENIEPKQEAINKTEQIKEIKPVTQEPKLDQNILAAQKFAQQNDKAEQEELNQQRLKKEHQEQQNEINRQQALAAQQEQDKQKALDKQKELDKQREADAQEERNKKQAELAAAKKRAEDIAKQKALDDAKAKKEAENKAERDRQKTIQNQDNTPVKISAGQARWRSRPNFTCDSDSTEEQTLNVTIHYAIDKAGNVVSSNLSRPTGNRNVDNSISQKARLAKFYPYLKNGIPVNSNVDISIVLNCK